MRIPALILLTLAGPALPACTHEESYPVPVVQPTPFPPDAVAQQRMRAIEQGGMASRLGLVNP